VADSIDPLHSPAWCVEAWVATMALRSLGFPSEQLFFGYVPVAGLGLCIVVQLQRKRADGEDGNFTWTLQRLPDADYAEVCAQWSAFIDQMAKAPQPVRAAVWSASQIVREGGPNYLRLGVQLKRCGFDVPELPQLGELERANTDGVKPSIVCWLSETEWLEFTKLLGKHEREKGTPACTAALLAAIAQVTGTNPDEVLARVRDHVLGVKVCPDTPANRWELVQ
jgi:hypothetical protein